MQYLISQRKKNYANSPQNFILFFYEKKNTNKKQYGKDIICLGTIKLVYAQ
jgi:hypothetical protein